MREWLARLFRGYAVRERVILHTKTGASIRGILWSRHREYLILRQAEMLSPGQKLTPLDGEFMVDRSNVDFLQVLTVTADR